MRLTERAIRAGCYLLSIALCAAPLAAPAAPSPLQRGWQPLSQRLPSPTSRRHGTKSQQCCLFVALSDNSGNNQVVAVDRDPPYSSMGTVAPEPGGFPWYLGIGSNGILYVGDPLTQSVYAYGNGFSQPPTATYPQAGAPVRLAVGNDGTLYVAVSVGSGASSYVVEYPKGRTKPGLMLPGPTNFYGLSLAVDGGGNVYVASERDGPAHIRATVELLTYAPHSKTSKLTILNAGTADLLSGGIAVDAQGNVLVGLVDAQLCPRVYVFASGSSLPSRAIGPPSQAFCGSLSNIRSVLLFGDQVYTGMLFESDQVLEYTYSTGSFVAGWRGPQNLPYTLTAAVGDAQPSR